MARWRGRKWDVGWGAENFMVSPAQKQSLDAIEYLLLGLAEAPAYSQDPGTGWLTITMAHNSISVDRFGRIKRKGVV